MKYKDVSDDDYAYSVRSKDGVFLGRYWLLEWAKDHQWSKVDSSGNRYRYYVTILKSVCRKTNNRAMVIVVGPLKLSWGKLRS